MSYPTALRLFAAGLISASVLRIITKLFYIDLETGFLIQGQWALSLLLVILAVIALSAIAASYQYKGSEPSPQGFHPVVCLLLALSGLLIAGHAGLRYLYPTTAPTLISVPDWLSKLELVLAACASLALLYAAACLYKVKGHCLKAAFATLFVVLWQSAWAIVRFAAFWQVSTVSDHLLEAFFLVLAPIFWMTQAYFLSGIPKKNIGRRLISLGLLLASIAIPLALGQAVALLAYKGQSVGPSPINCLMLLGIGTYAAALSINASKLYRS